VPCKGQRDGQDNEPDEKFILRTARKKSAPLSVRIRKRDIDGKLNENGDERGARASKKYSAPRVKTNERKRREQHGKLIADERDQIHVQPLSQKRLQENPYMKRIADAIARLGRGENLKGMAAENLLRHLEIHPIIRVARSIRNERDEDAQRGERESNPYLLCRERGTRICRAKSAHEREQGQTPQHDNKDGAKGEPIGAQQLER